MYCKGQLFSLHPFCHLFESRLQRKQSMKSGPDFPLHSSNLQFFRGTLRHSSGVQETHSFPLDLPWCLLPVWHIQSTLTRRNSAPKVEPRPSSEQPHLGCFTVECNATAKAHHKPKAMTELETFCLLPRNCIHKYIKSI